MFCNNSNRNTKYSNVKFREIVKRKILNNLVFASDWKSVSFVCLPNRQLAAFLKVIPSEMAHLWSSTKSLSPTPPWLPARGLDEDERNTNRYLPFLRDRIRNGVFVIDKRAVYRPPSVQPKCFGISSARTFGLMEKFIDLQIIHHGKHHFIIQSSFAIYCRSPPFRNIVKTRMLFCKPIRVSLQVVRRVSALMLGLHGKENNVISKIDICTLLHYEGFH